MGIRYIKHIYNRLSASQISFDRYMRTQNGKREQTAYRYKYDGWLWASVSDENITASKLAERAIYDMMFGLSWLISIRFFATAFFQPSNFLGSNMKSISFVSLFWQATTKYLNENANVKTIVNILKSRLANSNQKITKYFHGFYIFMTFSCVDKSFRRTRTQRLVLYTKFHNECGQIPEKIHVSYFLCGRGKNWIFFLLFNVNSGNTIFNTLERKRMEKSRFYLAMEQQQWPSHRRSPRDCFGAKEIELHLLLLKSPKGFNKIRTHT